jgi:release factor glutamine methyltransferase
LATSPDTASVLKTATQCLAEAGIASAALDARLLVASVLGIAADDLRLSPPHPLDHGQVATINRLIRRRLRREPVSRILGEREFWSLRFAIGRATLDPRPDSETLVEEVCRRLAPDARASILDLGTGSGCLLLAILSERINATGIGLDRSPAAVKLARLNAERLGLADRAKFISGDWATRRLQPADIVISNPPYIATKLLAGLGPELRYDPKAALDGGNDGLTCYRSITARLPRLLKQGGFVVFEIGYDQANPVAALLKAQDFTVGPAIRDLAGHDRVLVAQK